MHLLRTIILIGLMAIAAAAEARKSNDQPGVFDYYTVALSWSPSYCATHGDPIQCAPGRRHGFVLHGLWPQYERGYPENCYSGELPGDVRAKYVSLFPSAHMIGHEWRKHGTCTGLSPAAYFEMSAKLKKQIVVPKPFQQPEAPVRISHAEFVQAFNKANPDMASNAVLPYCAAGGRFLREIHVCYDKAGRSRACSEGSIKRSYNSCRQETFLMQNVR